MTNKRPYKFFVSKTSAILSLIIIILSLSAIFILDLGINTIEENAIPVSSFDNNHQNEYNTVKDKVFLSSIRDILVVVCSVLGTNLLLSIIIQSKSQNDMYDEFISEDLLQNRKFLQSIDPEKRKLLLRSIEKIDFLGENEVYSELIDNVRGKIVDCQYQLYFTVHNTDIVCSVLQGFIEKEIIRTMEIKSFGDSMTFKNFPIAQSTFEVMDGIKGIEIQRLSINGEEKDLINDVKYDEKDSNKIYHKNISYNKMAGFFLKDDIIFTHDKATRIEVTYTTRVPLNDRVYTSRLSAPCKKYDFRFRINDSNKKYKLYAQAFGFQENASKNPASSRINEVTYTIDNWTFPTDGVFITFNE